MKVAAASIAMVVALWLLNVDEAVWFDAEALQRAFRLGKLIAVGAVGPVPAHSRYVDTAWDVIDDGDSTCTVNIAAGAPGGSVTTAGWLRNSIQ